MEYKWDLYVGRAHIIHFKGYFYNSSMGYLMKEDRKNASE